MNERIEFEIEMPEMQVEGLVFHYRCGLSERWVKHKDLCGRLDGPWHYCTSQTGSTLPYASLEEAQAEAARQVVFAERRRLIQLAVERLPNGGVA